MFSESLILRHIGGSLTPDVLLSRDLSLRININLWNFLMLRLRREVR